ncbi:hypothetical protein ACLOJK_011065 [Asimina triloba]
MTKLEKPQQEAEEVEVEDALKFTGVEVQLAIDEDALATYRKEGQLKEVENVIAEDISIMAEKTRQQNKVDEVEEEDISDTIEVERQSNIVEDTVEDATNTNGVEGQPKDIIDAKTEELSDMDVQQTEEVDAEMEDEENDSFIDDSDGAEPSASDDDNETNSEAPLTDAEIEELVAEFLEVESKAAEAQESLEKESVARVESEVREELARSLEGDDLEEAVSKEMKIFVEEWEKALDDLEAESALLLEQLDGAGIELPKLYKWIESQAPNGCCTEAWKKRAHWVGCPTNSEVSDSVADAEKYLQSCRPVRRQHGRLLEEGASGFLGRKLTAEDNGDSINKPEEDWNSFNHLIQSHKLSQDSISFGSKHWASVYLASTPQQAAKLGLKLPGVDEVEEIDDIECTSSDPFYADAIANEIEIDLSEEQKKNFRKVKEEDDEKAVRKLQNNLKQRRRRKRHSQGAVHKDTFIDRVVENELDSFVESSQIDRKKGSSEIGEGQHNIENKVISSANKIDSNGDSGNLSKEKTLVNGTLSASSPSTSSDSSELRGCKCTHDGENMKLDNKRSRTDMDSEDEVHLDESSAACNGTETGKDPTVQTKEEGYTGSDAAHPSHSPTGSGFDVTEDSKKFNCTSCSKILLASDVHRHPLLEVIVCGSCKVVLEEKMQQKVEECKGIGFIRLTKIPIAVRVIVDGVEALKVDSQTVSSSDSDSDQSDAGDDMPRSNKKRRKKRIRRILDDAELGEETKRKIALEKARQEHLKSMQVQFAGKSWGKVSTSCNGSASKGATVEVLGDAENGFIVNVAREADEEPVRIPPSISSKLKPHQSYGAVNVTVIYIILIRDLVLCLFFVVGIRFMWENIIQSVKKVKSGDKGLGCILAHTMGLGKTFQVIAFLYTAMRGVDLGLRTALIVTPVNVLHNWRQEFIKWRPVELKHLRIFMLEDVSRASYICLLAVIIIETIDVVMGPPKKTLKEEEALIGKLLAKMRSAQLLPVVSLVMPPMAITDAGVMLYISHLYALGGKNLTCFLRDYMLKCHSVLGLVES